MKRLTNEQLHSIFLSRQEAPFKINAGPGTGKTFILTQIAEDKARTRQKGLYVAYNSAIVKEAGSKMPQSYVWSKTGHGLAFGSHGRLFGDRWKQRISGYSVSNHLNIRHSFYRGAQNEEFDISPSAIGNLALETVSRYCQSSDREIMIEHMPWDNLKVGSESIREQIARHVLMHSKTLWSLMSDCHGSFPTTHDVYLKLWALTNPRINRDYIMLDETQDSNPVLLDVLLKQTHAQLIFVGDHNQSIYQWRGAINAMQTVKFDAETELTHSFRFGQPIADIANQVLINYKNIPGNLKGFDEVSSTIGFCDRPDAIISRTNGVLMGKIIEQLDMGRRVGMGGGVGQIQSLVTGIGDLKAGKRTAVNELSLFRTYAELKEYTEGPLGGDLKPLIGHIETYGVPHLQNILSQVGSFGVNGKGSMEDQNFDVVVVTGHKSKGLEFGKVVLTDDFVKPDSPQFTEAEANLLFVAVTRTQNVLDISDCEAAKVALSGRVRVSNASGANDKETPGTGNRFAA